MSGSSETSVTSFVDLGQQKAGRGGDAAYCVGVLALQGAFREHIALLSSFGPSLEAVLVRTVDELDRIDALIIPGGESSCMRMLASEFNLVPKLREFANSGKAIWGICAGMILLAEQIDGELPIVGGLGMKVRRNHFGRQSNSSLTALTLHNSALEAGCCAVSHLIRAPAVCESALEKVEVLATVPGMNDAVVAVRSKEGEGLKLLATAFHPEITADKTWHAFFLKSVCGIDLDILRRFDLGRPLPDVGPNMLHGTTREVTITESPVYGSTSVKYGFARFLQGGVIMDVVNKEQARVAEEAGACAVMALERIPADIKQDGGIARMSDPELIDGILETVSVPVMAKARIGHFGEAEVLQALEVDCIDESEVLTPADDTHHIHKAKFRIPFVCGAKDLGEALRRIAEGAAMIRLKGDAGTGNVVHAVRHARQVFGEIRRLQSLSDDEVFLYAKNLAAPLELVQLTRKLGRLPVTTFAAGGIATPADVSMMMSMGCDGVFVGSGIFKGENSAQRAKACVKACTFWNDARVVANVSRNLGKGMVGILSKGESYNYVEDGKL